jgi:hypothetical protein
MKPLLLACGVWLFAFAGAVLGLIMSRPGHPDLTGQVILDHKPFCQSFVVQIDRDFVILDWEDGVLTFGETDTIVGPLRTGGLHRFDVIGRGVIEARLYIRTPNLLHAEQTFRARCGLDDGISAGTALVQ